VLLAYTPPDAVKKHMKFFGLGDDDEKADSNSLGSAAAVEALKLFNSRDSTQKQSKGAYMAVAMAEASKASF
jgi:hypothetical protein